MVVVLAASQLWRSRASADKAIVAFLALVALSLLVGLHWSEYQLHQGRRGELQPGPLPAAAGGRRRPRARARSGGWRPRIGRYAVAGVLGGLLVLQFLSLALILQRFYA